MGGIKRAGFVFIPSPMAGSPSALLAAARAQASIAKDALAVSLQAASSTDQVLVAWARVKPQLDLARRSYMAAIAADQDQAMVADYFDFEARIIERVVDELDAKKKNSPEKKLIIDRLHDDYGDIFGELDKRKPATAAIIAKLFPGGAIRIPLAIAPSGGSPLSSGTVAPFSSLSSPPSVPMDSSSTVAPSPGAEPGMPLSSALPFVEGVPGAQQPTLRFPNPRRRGHDSDDDEPVVDAGVVVPVPSVPTRPGAKGRVNPSNSEIRGELSFDDSD